MVRSHWLFLSSLILGAGTFAQTPLPSDVELRAAYCIPVIQNDIASLNHRRIIAETAVTKIHAGQYEELKNMPADFQADLLASFEKQQADLPKDISARESILNRLQLFLLPRMKYLDATALLGATSRGESDVQEFHDKIQQCLNETKKLEKGEIAPYLLKCTSGDLEDRIKACRNPTWLPF